VERVEYLVIGGGIAGISTAWWLAREGRDVTLLEQFLPGHDRGSSHGSVRIFRYVYPAADYIRLAQEALPLWRLAEEESGETLVELTGGIDFGDDDALHQLTAALDDEEVEYELLEPAAAAGRFPGFRFERPVLFQPSGGRCYADRALQALYGLALDHNAHLSFEEEAMLVESNRGRAVVTSSGTEYEADVCIVAAGAWVERLAGPHFTLPRLAVTREQPAYFAPRDPSLSWPSFIRHGARGSSASYGLLSPGEGLKVGIHMSGTVADPTVPTTESDPRALAELQAVAVGLLPGVDPLPVKVERCLYTTTPNEDFIIERSGPIIIASPCSGHGFKFGPAIGRMVAEFAMGRSEPPARFRLR
jgi:sarcosine oxidase